MFKQACSKLFFIVYIGLFLGSAGVPRKGPFSSSPKLFSFLPPTQLWKLQFRSSRDNLGRKFPFSAPFAHFSVRARLFSPVFTK